MFTNRKQYYGGAIADLDILAAFVAVERLRTRDFNRSRIFRVMKIPDGSSDG